MTSEHRHMMFISEVNHRQPCTVSPAHITREVERMERAGWALVSREPADETVPVMEVMLTFKKAEA
jgi:DNA-binding MarR family transcriptional regulator